MILFYYTNAQQNLVPNSSFEIYTNCPDNAAQLHYATPWFQPNVIYGNVINSCSSEYFNSCAINNAVSTPLNGVGFQFPRTGNAYVGIRVYFLSTLTDTTYSREYIECKLLNPLQKGKEYCISFYVSLADPCGYAVSNIGVYFSLDSLLYSSAIYVNINVIPQIKNSETNIIEDKENLVLISGEYIAEGGEQFITIGNFDTNINTNKKKLEREYYFSYYYIDDVSVYLCEDTLNPTDTFYLHIPNIFTPNADGLNDTWQVKANGTQQLSAAVYNRWGSLLWQQEVFADSTQHELHLSWNEHSNTGLPASAGTYFYLVSYTTKEEELKKEKGFLTLVR